MHEDFIMTDALVAKLDTFKWSIRFEPFIIRAKDPLEEMSRTKPERWDV